MLNTRIQSAMRANLIQGARHMSSRQTIKHHFQHAIPVFDSGIGSFAVVQEIQRQMPTLPLIYLADRKSFPYGDLSLPALRDNIQKRIKWFEANFNPPAIVVASNAPSMTILDQLHANRPIVGVRPPIQKAVAMSKTQHIAVLGTKNLVQSAALQQIKSELTDTHLHLVDASVLIESMERFQFVLDTAGTDRLMQSFFKDLFLRDPLIDTVTLSSTHLSFLDPIIRRHLPNLVCLDPANEVAQELSRVVSVPSSKIVPEQPLLLVLTTESSVFSAQSFSKGLALLGFKGSVEVVDINDAF